MPVMNGWEYLKEFRKISAPKAPAVIVISAFSDAAVKAKQESVDYFKKPVNIDALLKTIKKYCS
jgi:DNA-binding response OmpR family regulator